MRKSVEVEPGTVVEKNCNGNLCMGKLRYNSWPIETRAAFLDHLAATCNVRASAKAAGVLAVTAYKMRRRDPEFAEAWQNALETGYVALETLLVARAIEALEIPVGETPIGDDGCGPDVKAMDPEIALRVLGQHKRSVKASFKKGGPPLQRATEEEACTMILTKLEILRARIDAGEA